MSDRQRENATVLVAKMTDDFLCSRLCLYHLHSARIVHVNLVMYHLTALDKVAPQNLPLAMHISFSTSLASVLPTSLYSKGFLISVSTKAAYTKSSTI